MLYMGFKAYEKSINNIGSSVAFISENKGETVIIASSILGFKGEDIGNSKVRAPLNHENACNLRKLFPFCAPSRGLKKLKSVSIDTMPELKTFQNNDVFPFVCRDVLDEVTFTMFREGYKKPFGADGGQLKTAEEVEDALSFGATMISLDCCGLIKKDVTPKNAPPAPKNYVDKYLNQKFDIEGIYLIFSSLEELNLCVAMYKDMIAFATDVYKRFLTTGNAELEISLVEDNFAATPLHHYFVARELLDSGILFATASPGFSSEEDLKVHAAITRSLGYKLSISIDQKKSSMFPTINKETRGNFHIKTTHDLLPVILQS